jgi:hypothetical protein
MRKNLYGRLNVSVKVRCLGVASNSDPILTLCTVTGLNSPQQREYQRQGIGRKLVTFGAEAVKHGAHTATVGTDDDSGLTSLAGVDLYTDLPRHIAEIRDLG